MLTERKLVLSDSEQKTEKVFHGICNDSFFYFLFFRTNFQTCSWSVVNNYKTNNIFVITTADLISFLFETKCKKLSLAGIKYSLAFQQRLLFIQQCS